MTGHYAAVYDQYHTRRVRFGTDLRDLIYAIEDLSDQGDCYIAHHELWVFELDAAGQWAPVDRATVDRIVDEHRDEDGARYQAQWAFERARPWAVVLVGPLGTVQHHSRYASREEAETSAAALRPLPTRVASVQ